MQHRRNRKLATLAAALTAAALAAPISQAALDVDARHQALLDKAPQAQVDARHQALLRHHEVGPSIYVTTAPKPTVASDGMDWGNAGIGAATTVGVILLGVGGVLAGRRRLSHA
jgi:hypothetical protein